MARKLTELSRGDSGIGNFIRFLFYGPYFTGLANTKSRENWNEMNREYLVSQTKDETSPLYGLTSEDIDQIMNEYANTSKWKLFDSDTWGDDFDVDAFNEDLQDYKSWKDKVGALPEYVDYDKVAADANAAIDAENAEIMQLYDEMLGRSTDMYEQNLAASNQMYNDYVGQMMSNQAQSQNMLQGSVRSELSRASRNAINRGASAAMKLVSNVNAQLGLQNQSAMNALTTSNTLAQALLNQRQAAMQTRNDYAGELNQYANNKAGLISGTAERKANYRDSMYNEQDKMYNQKLNQWEDKLAGYGGSSVWGNIHRNASRRNDGQSSKYGL